MVRHVSLLHSGLQNWQLPRYHCTYRRLPHTYKFYHHVRYLLTWAHLQQDVIYYWSRPHPKGATASADQFGKPSGWDWSLVSNLFGLFCNPY